MREDTHLSTNTVLHQKSVLNNSELTDVELLFRIREHEDKKAYQQLVERYLKPLWKLASNILHDQAEAEDIIQEVFMGLWQKKLNWDEKGSAQLTTWLYRVVLNKCIDIKRKRSSGKLATLEVPIHLKDQRPHSEEILQTKQKKHVVKDALSGLPDTQRRAMHLFYYEDWRMEDIAKHMGTSIDSVKSLLKRGRARLKTDLSKT